MINAQQISGNWNQIKGKLRERWGQLTDDQLQSFNGNVDQLIGTIQEKTGASREAVENFLSDLTAQGATVVNRMADTAREYAEQSGETVRRAAEYVREGAGEMVQRNPTQSVLALFSAGLVAGFVFGVLVHER